MKQTEALRLALEALEGVLDDSPKVLEASISGGLYEVAQCRDAITAIKEALEQPAPVQEPASSNVEAKWLGDALFDCIKASGIIRKDIGSLSVAELLFFAQDLKGMLERQAATPPAAQPAPVQPMTLADEVIGCFDAAEVEGLTAALINTDDHHLKDLVERRLMNALYAAQKLKEESK